LNDIVFQPSLRIAYIVEILTFNSFSVDYNPYSPLWNKYRPVIIKLMSEAAREPQQYKLYGHEFKAMGQKVKSGYSFVLEVAKGKAVNKIKGSIVAHDLLQVLQQSTKAMQLMQEATYELSLDKSFVFRVSRKALPADVAATDVEKAKS
jgi:hypothetical protein